MARPLFNGLLAVRLAFTSLELRPKEKISDYACSFPEFYKEEILNDNYDWAIKLKAVVRI